LAEAEFEKLKMRIMGKDQVDVYTQKIGRECEKKREVYENWWSRRTQEAIISKLSTRKKQGKTKPIKEKRRRLLAYFYLAYILVTS